MRAGRATLLVTTVVLASLSILAPLSTEVSAYTPHAPISIIGNAQFTPANGVTGGSGTWLNPYIIEGWEIDATAAHGIRVFSTDAHFVIRNTYIHSGSMGAYPIFFVGVKNGVIENVTVSDSAIGVNMGSSTNVTLRGSRIDSNSDYGVYSFQSNDLAIESSEFLNNGVDMQIESSSDINITKNELWSMGVGIYSRSSKRVTIEDNSIVNHNNGISLLYADNNTITNNDISNNTFGIVLDRGIGPCFVAGNYVHGNKLGIYVSSDFARIISNNVSWNTADGIQISHSPNATIISNNISSNEGYGLGIVASMNATIVGNAFESDGAYITGDSISAFNSHNITTDNQVNGKPLYYHKDCNGLTVNGIDVGQLIVVNCTRMVASNIRIENTDVGIEMAFVNESTITASVVSDDDFGIYPRYSSNITVKSNTISGMKYAGIYFEMSSSIAVEDNNVTSNGNQGIYISASTNVTLSGNAVRSSRVSAIRLEHASFVTVRRNNITGGEHGILLDAPNNLTITNNTIFGTWNGTYSVNTATSVIAGNRILWNLYYGIYLKNSILVSVHGNSFVNNGLQAYDDRDAENTWDHGYPDGGNYWSDYAGLDLFSGPNQDVPGNDGVGDTPYVIDLDSEDKYPLMNSSIVPLPDLVVSSSDITFSQLAPLKQGVSVSIGGVIWNNGSMPSGPTVSRFYDGVPPSLQIGGDIPLAPISIGDLANVSVEWIPMTAGSHEICLIVDPLNSVQEEDETNNIACRNVEVAFSRQIAPGHWFISFPLMVADDSIESVLSSISGCYDYVRWYDATDATSPWKSYSPARGHNGLLRLDNAMGFWIDVTATCDLVITGTWPSSTAISLHQGWNMVGFPSSNTSYTVADLKAGIGLAEVIVEAFDSTAAPYYLQRVGDSYVMIAWEGYWIYVPSDATWIVEG